MTTGRFPRWTPEDDKPRRWQPSRRFLAVLAALNGVGLLIWSCATVQIAARMIGAPEVFGYAMALPVGVAVIAAIWLFISRITEGRNDG